MTKAKKSRSRLLTEDEMRAVIEDACLNLTNATVARKIGVGKQLITEILNLRSGISDRVAGALGYERLIMYRKIGKGVLD